MEQSVGILKWVHHFSCMRYIVLKKRNMELLLNVTAFNLKKVATMPE